MTQFNKNRYITFKITNTINKSIDFLRDLSKKCSFEVIFKQNIKCLLKNPYLISNELRPIVISFSMFYFILLSLKTI
jgi:hypothetical protein